MSQRRIVYIRAAGLPPLYIEHQGKYYPIEAYSVPDASRERKLIETTPECLREDDWVVIRYWNPSHQRSCIERIPVSVMSRFTDTCDFKEYAPSGAYEFA